MSDKNLQVLFPTGRAVQGDFYTPNTTNAEGKPLVYKTGPNAGQPRPDYYFAVAIPKTQAHWAQESWGAPIWAFAHAAWPAGQAQRPDFAWKISDGDSQIPNKVGKKPCDQVGHKGNWIVRFSSSYAPKIVNANGSAYLLEPNAVKCGDYVQVFGDVRSNESTQTAGIHINHSIVSLQGFGDAISTGPDAAAVGFGGGALPPGASAVPVGAMVAPPVVAAPAPVVAAPPVPAMPAPAPNVAFVAGAAGAPPVPVAPAVPVAPPAKVMTAKAAAEGLTYEAMLAANWTDALMIQHGYLAA